MRILIGLRLKGRLFGIRRMHERVVYRGGGGGVI
jgi:hypothetical protein